MGKGCGPTTDPMDATGDSITLDKDHPTEARRFTLMRLGEIHGRVVNEDGRSIADLRVGIRPAISPKVVVTDQDGFFVATKLKPGDYFVEITPEHGPEIVAEFSEGDLKKVDVDLEGSNWPSVPVPVIPPPAPQPRTCSRHARRPRTTTRRRGRPRIHRDVPRSASTPSSGRSP